MSPALVGKFFTTSATWEAINIVIFIVYYVWGIWSSKQPYLLDIIIINLQIKQQGIWEFN